MIKQTICYTCDYCGKEEQTTYIVDIYNKLPEPCPPFAWTYANRVGLICDDHEVTVTKRAQRAQQREE